MRHLARRVEAGLGLLHRGRRRGHQPRHARRHRERMNSRPRASVACDWRHAASVSSSRQRSRSSRTSRCAPRSSATCSAGAARPRTTASGRHASAPAPTTRSTSGKFGTIPVVRDNTVVLSPTFVGDRRPAPGAARDLRALLGLLLTQERFQFVQRRTGRGSAFRHRHRRGRVGPARRVQWGVAHAPTSPRTHRRGCLPRRWNRRSRRGNRARRRCDPLTRRRRTLRRRFARSRRRDSSERAGVRAARSASAASVSSVASRSLQENQSTRSKTASSNASRMSFTIGAGIEEKARRGGDAREERDQAPARCSRATARSRRSRRSRSRCTSSSSSCARRQRRLGADARHERPLTAVLDDGDDESGVERRRWAPWRRRCPPRASPSWAIVAKGPRPTTPP